MPQICAVASLPQSSIHEVSERQPLVQSLAHAGTFSPAASAGARENRKAICFLDEMNLERFALLLLLLLLLFSFFSPQSSIPDLGIF